VDLTHYMLFVYCDRGGVRMIAVFRSPLAAMLSDSSFAVTIWTWWCVRTKLWRMVTSFSPAVSW
jgi:hypothetical protein